MPKYIFTYHQPAGYLPDGYRPGGDAKVTAAWQGFFETIADHIADPGQPVFTRTAVGETGTSTQLGGYSVTATSVVEQISREVSATATLRLLFENPMIGEFAEKLRTLPAEDDSSVEEGVL